MTVVTRQRLRRRIGGPSGAPLQLRSGELFADEAVSGDPELYYGKGNDGSGNATDVVPLTGGLRPWPSRAAFAAATIPDDVQSWSFWSPAPPAANAILVRFNRHPTGHACESANGVKGVPADPVWLIDHYIDNVEPGVTDCSPAFAAAHADVPQGAGIGDGGAVLSGQPGVDYRLNSTVTITKHNLQIVGQGGRSSLNLVNGAAVGDVLVIGPANVTSGTDPAIDTPRTYHPVVRNVRLKMAPGVEHFSGRGILVRNTVGGSVAENDFDGIYDPVALMSTANLYFGPNQITARGRTRPGGTMLALLQNPDIPSRENTGLHLLSNEGKNAGTGDDTPGYREGLRIEAVDGLYLEGMNHFNGCVVGCVIEGKPGSLITDVNGRLYVDKAYGTNLVIKGDTGDKPFQRIDLDLLVRAAGGNGFFTWWTDDGDEVLVTEGVYTDPGSVELVTVPGCEHWGQGIYVNPGKIISALTLTGSVAVSQREALTIASNKLEGPKVDLFIDRPNRDDETVVDVTLNGSFGQAALRYRGGDAAGKPLHMAAQSAGWTVRLDTTLSASAEAWTDAGTDNHVRDTEAFWGGPARPLSNYNDAVTSGPYVAADGALNGPTSGANARVLVLAKNRTNVTQTAITATGRQYERSLNAGVWSAWTRSPAFTADVPAANASTGTRGDLAMVAGRLFVCTSDGAWAQVPLNDVTTEPVDQRALADIILPTRAAAVAWVAVNSARDGTLMHAAGMIYVAKAGSTKVPDMPGWEPFLAVHADHFAENLTPGTTSMSAALSAAWASFQDVNLTANRYLIDDQVLLSLNRRSLVGKTGTFLDIASAAGVSAIKIANASPDTPGAQGPSNIYFDRMVIRRLTEAPDTPLIEAIVPVGLRFGRVEWWGGTPNLVLRGAKNVDLVECKNAANIAFSARADAAFVQTHWTYSDGSIEGGFSVRTYECRWSGWNTVNVAGAGPDYGYERIWNITCADVFEAINGYMGACPTYFALRPTVASQIIGGVRLVGTHMDDGGADYRGENTYVVIDNTAVPNTIVNMVTMDACRMTGPRIGVDITSGPTGKVAGINVVGGFWGGLGESAVKVRGNAANKTANVTVTGANVYKWDTSGIGAALFDVDKMDTLSLAAGLIAADSGAATSIVARCASAGGAHLALGAVDFKDVTQPIEVASETNWSSVLLSPSMQWTGAGANRAAFTEKWRRRAFVPLGVKTVTDLTAELAPGIYGAAEATVIGGPTSGGPSAFNLTILVGEADWSTGGQTFFATRHTVTLGSIRTWVGSRATKTGAITWSELFGQHNLLGTVSQSGGLPTGRVIERGSNANGEYVRFADGTQICTKTVTGLGPISTAAGALYVSSGISPGNWAAAFAAAPNQVTGCYSGAGSAVGYYRTGAATTTAAGNIVLWRTASSAATDFAVTLTAIGRWF